MSKYGVISGPYFPVFGLNTERYGVSLRIQFEYRKTQIRNNSVFGHFLRSNSNANYHRNKEKAQKKQQGYIPVSFRIYSSVVPDIANSSRIYGEYYSWKEIVQIQTFQFCLSVIVASIPRILPYFVQYFISTCISLNIPVSRNIYVYP